ncbi:MAG: hypothetical protein HKN27_13055 [Silicimonas sp.]|nr:hypothetical protein [Silicimonas sp.]
MAKKRGFFGTLGTFFRVSVVVLAGILVYAIWQNFSTETEVVAEAPVEAPVVEAEVEEPVVAEADEMVEETTEAATDQAQEMADAVTEQVDDMREVAEDTVAAVTETVEEKVEEAEEAVASVTGMATDAGDKAEEAVAALTAEAEQAVDEVKDKAENALNDLLKPKGDAASSTAALKVPGDDTTYAMIEATRAADGSIEVISQKTGEDMTLSSVTCAPLTLGVMATGATPEALETRAEPEMVRLVLGTPEAALAAYACGAVE